MASKAGTTGPGVRGGSSRAKSGKLSSQSRSAKEVPIRFRIPDDIQTLFVQNVVIQHAAEEFTLSFFHVTQPILLNPGDADALEVVESTCVSRIVMTPSAFKTTLDAAFQNWENYARRYNREG